MSAEHRSWVIKQDLGADELQAYVAAEKLERAGKPVTYIEQPEADHAFSREADRLQFLRELEAFLKTHNPA